MKENLVFITGGSKGIGLGLVKAYLQAGYRVCSLARSEIRDQDFLDGLALEAKARLHQVVVDLNAIETLPNFLQDLLLEVAHAQVDWAQLTWINNAGILGEMAAIEDVSPESIVNTIQLNLTVPMLCAQAFIQHCRAGHVKASMLINISSGAALKPYHGWSAYCASKAGLDSLTQTIALEQSSLEQGTRVLGIHPGVVDTGMQSLIRAQNEVDFKSLARFIQLKEQNELRSPAEVGQMIFEVSQQDWPNGHITRI